MARGGPRPPLAPPPVPALGPGVSPVTPGRLVRRGTTMELEVIQRRLAVLNTAIQEGARLIRAAKRRRAGTQEAAEAESLETAWGICLMLDGSLPPAVAYAVRCGAEGGVAQEALQARFLRTPVEAMLAEAQEWRHGRTRRAQQA
ncbi:MAG: hypothetical protein GY772_22330, partial [bacterium]|nr:hypothetical protein [bacterium]